MSNENKIPSSLKKAVEARRKAKGHIRTDFNPVKEMKEAMERKFASFDYFNSASYRATQAIERINQIKEQTLASFAYNTSLINNFTFPDYTSEIKQMFNQFRASETALDSFNKYYQTLATSNIIDFRTESYLRVQDTIAEALKPSFRFHDNIHLKIQDQFETLWSKIKDFEPRVEVSSDSLIIEKERFTREDIGQIAKDYIWDEKSDKNIFKQDEKHFLFKKTPKSVQWLICIIITTIITVYLTAFFNELTKNSIWSPERVAKRLVHFRKKEIREISKNKERKPTSFVNAEKLSVHIAPRKRSQTIGVLSYPYKVKVLKYKNKKRWVLIEWTSETDEKCKGWVLGRYIFRKNVLVINNDDGNK